MVCVSPFDRSLPTQYIFLAYLRCVMLTYGEHPTVGAATDGNIRVNSNLNFRGNTRKMERQLHRGDKVSEEEEKVKDFSGPVITVFT